MTKEQFNSIDLRKQLTDDLKSKWYFKQSESELKIYKHHVVFDEDYEFKLVYHPEIIKNGEVLVSAYIDVIDENNNNLDLYFDDDELDNSKDILEHILLYIANCI